MPAKNHLNSEQLEKLQKALKEEEKGEIRERILIFLLLNDGKTQAQIAEFLGCSLNKVSYWCVHGDPENLESLKDERMKGNHKKTTDKYIEILLETIDKEPEELGYEFGRWTALKISNIFRKKYRNSIKRLTSKEDIKSIEELETLLHQLLNEGELVIKWGRKIKNKGDAVIPI
jgi:transposase